MQNGTYKGNPFTVTQRRKPVNYCDGYFEQVFTFSKPLDKQEFNSFCATNSLAPETHGTSWWENKVEIDGAGKEWHHKVVIPYKD